MPRVLPKGHVADRAYDYPDILFVIPGRALDRFKFCLPLYHIPFLHVYRKRNSNDDHNRQDPDKLPEFHL